MTGFEKWWPILLSATRDIAALTVGVYILVVKQNPPTVLTVIGFLLLTLSASGAAKTFTQLFGRGTPPV